MSTDNLRFLCDVFRLKRGGGKEELVSRLLNSEYTPEEITGPAGQLALGILVEEFVPKSFWMDLLRADDLPSSGSRHELLLRLVENRLFHPRESLEILNPAQLREIYHELFGRVPTADDTLAIAGILDVFGLAENEKERSREDVNREEAGREKGRTFDYDVALSFAGEQRPYVEQVAKTVAAAGVSVFYDDFEEVRMWGRDLPSFLEQLFREKARFCVLFLSADYARKAFPRWEGQAAIARLVKQKGEYILPIRFDSTDLPGLPPMTKYLDGQKLTPPQVAANILEKLRLETGTPDAGPPNKPTQNAQPEPSVTGADAERIAIEFVKGKKPNAEISVSSVRLQGPSRWTVEGDVYEKHERGGSSSHWLVEIEGIRVLSYDLKPGVGWYLG